MAEVRASTGGKPVSFNVQPNVRQLATSLTFNGLLTFFLRGMEFSLERAHFAIHPHGNQPRCPRAVDTNPAAIERRCLRHRAFHANGSVHGCFFPVRPKIAAGKGVRRGRNGCEAPSVGWMVTGDSTTAPWRLGLLRLQIHLSTFYQCAAACSPHSILIPYPHRVVKQKCHT